MTLVRRTLTANVNYTWRTNGFDSWKTVNSKYYDTEELIWGQTNHYPLNPKIDDGGPFLVHRVLDQVKPCYANTGSGGWYNGDLVVGGPSGSFTKKTVSMVPESTLNARGTTAIARSLPNNSAWEASTFLGETLTGGLPMISGMTTIKNRARVARSAGSEYLNVQFGWLPLIRDVREFASAVRDSHEILENYRKGSDKKIRRRYSFPDSRNETRLYAGNFFASPASHYNQFGSGTMSEHYENKQWFSGAFRYHIPTSSTQLGKFQEWRRNADILLGVSLDPETLWNIAPWSWAVDWFTNTGDIMTNISGLGKDGLVMQYGYMMSHSQVTHHTVATFPMGSGRRTPPTARIQKNEWKMRVPATPYGFGVNLSSLTAKQVAIIAALGLSRT